MVEAMAAWSRPVCSCSTPARLEGSPRAARILANPPSPPVTLLVRLPIISESRFSFWVGERLGKGR